MALRVAEPTPLRTTGFGASAGGALVTILSGFQGPAALIGVAVLCLGIALLDAVDAGRVGGRQLGLFLLALGGVVGMWALVVTVLLAMLGLPADPVALVLLAGGTLAVGGGVFLIRYASGPRAAPAVVVHGRRHLESQQLDRLAG